MTFSLQSRPLLGFVSITPKDRESRKVLSTLALMSEEMIRHQKLFDMTSVHDSLWLIIKLSNFLIIIMLLLHKSSIFLSQMSFIISNSSCDEEA